MRTDRQDLDRQDTDRRDLATGRIAPQRYGVLDAYRYIAAICVAAGTRLCLHMRWRPGKAVSATGWLEAMEQLWQPAEIRSRLWLNRGDTGFGQEAICAWHEVQGPARPKYLFKLRLTRNVRRAIANIRPEAWRGCPTPS